VGCNNLTEVETENLSFSCRRIREKILDLAFEAGKVGRPSHIGGSLSCADILGVVFATATIGIDSENKFVMSKGHAALALYAALSLRNQAIREVLDSGISSNTLLGHPVKNASYNIEFSTGSLGIGLSYAAGLAVYKMKRHLSGRIYALIGDGECNTFEALRFIGLNGLSNFTVLIDRNNFQQTGKVGDITGSLDLCSYLRALRLNVIEIDGHDVDALKAGLKAAVTDSLRASVLVCNTVKGKGLPPSLVGTNGCHHMVLTEAVYREAKSFLGGGIGKN
jgi:transketolase